MEFFLIILFGFISFSMFIWGYLKENNRFLQYPFIASCAWCYFVLPQTIGVYLNKNTLPNGVREDGGLIITIIFCIICLLMSFAGYQKGKEKASFKKINTKMATISEKKIFISGLLLGLIAFYGYSGLAKLSGGYIQYFSTSGNYNLTWTGLPVIYSFFLALIYPSILLQIISYFKRKKFYKLIILFISSLLPLCMILFLGRRSHLLYFLSVIGISYYFSSKRAPSKILVTLLLMFCVLAIILMPEYRKYSQIGLDNKEILNIDISENVNNIFSGKTSREFSIAVTLIQTHNEVLKFNYGFVYINRIIQDFIPAMVVGRKLKNILFLKTYDVGKLTIQEYQWDRNRYFYIASMGFTEVFQQFWYFGCFMFYLIGYFYGYLWTLAEKDHFPSILFYSYLTPQIILTITNDFGLIFSKLVYGIIFLFPVYFFVKYKIKF